MSTPVSVQDSSPVSWTSWESRFLPMGACADGVFGVSLAGTSCWGGAGVSRTSCARRACGNATAESEKSRVKASLHVRIMNTGHPAQGQEASSQLTDARGRHKPCPGGAAELVRRAFYGGDGEAANRFAAKDGSPCRRVLGL